MINKIKTLYYKAKAQWAFVNMTEHRFKEDDGKNFKTLSYQQKYEDAKAKLIDLGAWNA